MQSTVTESELVCLEMEVWGSGERNHKGVQKAFVGAG